MISEDEHTKNMKKLEDLNQKLKILKTLLIL